MRLIDADELKGNASHIEILYTGGRSTGKTLKNFELLFIEKINHAPTIDAIPISVIKDIKADISLLRDATINVNEDTAYGLWIALDLINKHINNNELIGRNEI